LTIRPSARAVLLGLGGTLAQFAAVAVADVAGEGVAAFAAVELGQDAPAKRLAVAVVQQVDRPQASAHTRFHP
jgi:hypothetical protein